MSDKIKNKSSEEKEESKRDLGFPSLFFFCVILIFALDDC